MRRLEEINLDSQIKILKNLSGDSSLDICIEESQLFGERGIVILQGDFNALTGTAIDYISEDKIDDEFGKENYKKPIPRNSHDKEIAQGVQA